MRISGSSRKDGMTLYGKKYAVTVKYQRKSGEYTYSLRTQSITGAGESMKNTPLLRGLYSLWRNTGMKVALAMSVVGIVGERLTLCPKHSKRRKLGYGMVFAQYGFTAVMLYKIFGLGNDVRLFHGAEHKVINAYTLKQEEITEEEAERASRISRRCGTNYVVYVTAAGMTIGLLPLGHGLFQQLLTMGIAYEAFQMPTEKCPVVKSTLNLAGDALQRKIMTQEPHKGQLEAARKALNLLLAAEKGTLAEEEKQKYMENARERSWLDRLIG